MNNQRKFYYKSELVPGIRLKNGGKIISFPTIDRRVRMLIITGDFIWKNQAIEEVKFCDKCRSFVMPEEQGEHGH